MLFCELKTVRLMHIITFQYNENNRQFSTKIIKISLPLKGLDEITKAFMELSQGIRQKLPMITSLANTNENTNNVKQ